MLFQTYDMLIMLIMFAISTSSVNNPLTKQFNPLCVGKLTSESLQTLNSVSQPSKTNTQSKSHC